MEKLVPKKILWISFIILFLIVGWYFIFSNNSSDSTQEEKKSIEEVSDLALSLSDFPNSSGWEISTRGEITNNEVNEYYKELGWVDGYEIIFRKIDSKDVQVVHSSSRYPLENISLVLEPIKYQLERFNKYSTDYNKNIYGKYRYQELSEPNLGEDSVAYKLVYIEDDAEDVYYIEFVKATYYEYVGGYDYELVKELAKKAEILI